MTQLSFVQVRQMGSMGSIMGDGEHGVMHGKKDMLTAMVKPVGRNGQLWGAMGCCGA